jgi:hypothetical protein
LHAKQRCLQCRRLFQPQRSTERFCGDTCRSLHRYHRNKDIARHDWHSPSAIVEAARALMGAIDLDPASCAKANEVVAAKTFYSPAEDGLKQPWAGRVYSNPPYGGHVGDWVEKLITEYEAGNVLAAVALLPARTDTRCSRGSTPFRSASFADGCSSTA